MTVVTIYWNPSDYPQKFVARASRNTRRRIIDSARPLAVVDTLEEARAAVELRHPGLVIVSRDESDDPCIVEVHL